MSNDLIVKSESDSIMDNIMMFATHKDFDAEKLKIMQQMFFDKQDRERDAAFSRDFVLAQAELPKIPKRGAIKDAGGKVTSRYELLEDIIDLTSPILSNYGFGMSFGEYSSELAGCIGISCTLFHRDGGKKEFKYDCPLDAVGKAGTRNKTDVHAKGSAVSYGRRYLCRMIWNLSTGDDDDGVAAGKLIQKVSEEQVSILDAMIEEIGVKKHLVLELWKVGKLSDLPASGFENCVQALERRRARVGL